MSIKGLWAEFKAFAFKGNMIELAVAVIIGGAFGTVITSLVNDVIMPTVGYVVNTATTAAKKAENVAASTVSSVASHTGLSIGHATSEPAATTAAIEQVPPRRAIDASAEAPPAAPGAPPPSPAGPVQINLMIGPVNAGKFIGALLNFLLVAAAVFLVIVKLLGSVMKSVGRQAEPTEPTTRECPECLSLIRIKARRCSACTAVVGNG